jgi:hypothetical protein
MWLFIPSAEKHVLLICVRDASILLTPALVVTALQIDLLPQELLQLPTSW